jgi:hypothetical protein
MIREVISNGCLSQEVKQVRICGALMGTSHSIAKVLQEGIGQGYTEEDGEVMGLDVHIAQGILTWLSVFSIAMRKRSLAKKRLTQRCRWR